MEGWKYINFLNLLEMCLMCVFSYLCCNSFTINFGWHYCSVRFLFKLLLMWTTCRSVLGWSQLNISISCSHTCQVFNGSYFCFSSIQTLIYAFSCNEFVRPPSHALHPRWRSLFGSYILIYYTNTFTFWTNISSMEAPAKWIVVFECECTKKKLLKCKNRISYSFISQRNSW